MRNVAELHREWLALFDLEGPFLAVPVLKRVWPNAIPDFKSTHPDRVELLNDARRTFEAAWEAADRQPADKKQQDAFRSTRDEWVEIVLRNVVGWGEMLECGTVSGIQAQSPNRVVTVTAQGALRGPEGIAALVHVIDPVDSLRRTPNDVWAATPIDRLEALLRGNGVRVGIVTDGRWWGLVHAAEGIMTASGVVDALTWSEEARVRDAFFTLVSRQHIVGGDPMERLPALFEESVAAAEEVTEALGSQVRQAVELLIQSFSESALDARTRGQSDPLPDRTHEIYEAAVTMMMRIVFLLFAEERGLLPSGELFELGYGISGELDRLTAEGAQGEESLDATALTWHRLLATSRAIYQGASFENLRMPAYGGSLFDPTRFSFLSATSEQGTLSIRVTDRVMFHVLRSIQVVTVKGEARRISFRDIDVEQIGYIYEGLLGYTCVRVNEPVLGLIGRTGSEPEIPLQHLETLAADNPDSKRLANAIQEWLRTNQPSSDPPTVAALGKALSPISDPAAVSALSQTVGGDAELVQRVTPWLGAIRRDLRGQPFIVRAGGLLVAETPSRQNAGAHYTPKSLAEEVVLHALQPLCYSPGPHQTADESIWTLRSSDDLLDLKVADIACGSGAFLVAAARYLADRVVEAWISEDQRNAERKDLHVRAVRQVVANCLYGADINEMAVEMCKLSLWLVSLDRDLPFSFVDDKIFHGNSLLGLTTLDQIRKLHIDPKSVPQGQSVGFFDVNIDSIIDKAVDLRGRLASEIDDDDPMRSSAAKHRQLDELQRVTVDLRRIADGVIAAGLSLGGRPGKALDEAYERLREAVAEAYPQAPRTPSSRWLDGLIDAGLTPTVETDYVRWKPLHWVIEVPDVIVDHGGFDAVIGNPPFLAGKKISIANGSNIESWLKHELKGAKGSADLCAHFIRRGWRLLKETGVLGNIANDRIRQGDTAAMSCAVLLKEGRIYRAVSVFKWPGSASTSASLVWATRNRDSAARPVLDGTLVSDISASLSDATEADLSTATDIPLPISVSFGVGLYGEGFLLEQDDPLVRNLGPGELGHLLPFVNGESLLSGRPSGRLAISVNQFPDESTLRAAVPMIADHLRRTVKPVRDGIKSQVHDARFWGHWDKRERFFNELRALDSFVATAETTRVPIFLMLREHDALYSNKVILFATSSFCYLGVLSSSVHFSWFEETRTPRGAGSSYTVSRVVRTFAFPDNLTTDLSAAATVFSERRELLALDGRSYTEIHNQLDDPNVTSSDIESLRSDLIQMDREVIRCYGWSDLDISHGFEEYAGGLHFSLSRALRVEIRRRLLEENLRRAAGALNTSANNVAVSKRKKSEPQGMMELF